MPRAPKRIGGFLLAVRKNLEAHVRALPGGSDEPRSRPRRRLGTTGDADRASGAQTAISPLRPGRSRSGGTRLRPRVVAGPRRRAHEAWHLQPAVEPGRADAIELVTQAAAHQVRGRPRSERRRARQRRRLRTRDRGSRAKVVAAGESTRARHRDGDRFEPWRERQRAGGTRQLPLVSPARRAVLSRQHARFPSDGGESALDTKPR